MKKFFKRVGKVTGMVILYLLIAVGTAAGIIFLSPAEVKEDASAKEIPAQLLSIVERFEKAKALDINLNAEIDTGDKNIKIAVDGQLDLSGGFENIKADGNIQLDLNGQNFDINLAYDGKQIFLELFNGKFCMETDNIMEAVTKITGILDVSMPDIGGIDLGTMDMETILGMLSDLTETINGNTSTIVINVPVVGALTIVCDLDYSVKSISLPRVDLSGTGLRLSANIDYPEMVEFVQPEQEEFVDVSELLEVATAVIDVLNNDEFAFDLSATTNEFSIDGTINVDVKNRQVMLESNILDLPLKVVCKNDTIFLEYGNIYLKFAFADLDKVSSLLEKHFDIVLPMDKISAILSCLKEGDFAKLLGGLGLGDMSLDSVDLSVLQGLSRDGDEFVISLKDIGQISVFTPENKFESLTFAGDSLNIDLTTSAPKEIQLAQKKHADIAKVIPAIDAVMETTEQNNISGTAEFEVGSTTLAADFDYAKDENGIQAQIKANILGKQLVLTYQKDMFFMEFAGLKICGSLEEIGDVLKMIVASAGLESTDSGKIVSTIKEMLDSNTFVNFISLENAEDGIKVGLLDKIFATIKYDTLLKEINVESEKINAKITLSYEEVEIEDIESTGFMHISEVADEVEGLYNYIKQNTFYIELDAAYKDFELTGAINYDENGLRAQIVLSAFEQTATINVVKDVVYLDFKEMHLQGSFEELKTIIGAILTKFDIKVEKLPDNLFENISLEQLLANIQLRCSEGSLFVEGQDFNAQICFEGSTPSSLVVKYNDFAFNLYIKNTARAITPIDDQTKYAPLSEIVDKALWIVDYVKAGEYYADVDVKIGEDIAVKGKVNYNSNGLSADIKVTAKDVEGTIKVIDEVVYFDFKQLHISFAFTEVDALAEFVKQQFGLDIKAKLGQMQNTKDLDIAGLLTALALGFQNNSLQLGYQDIFAQANFEDNELQNVVLTYGDITATITLCEAETIVEKPDGDYTPATEILSKVSALMEYIDGSKYYAKIEGSIKDVALNGAVNYDENGLSAILTANYKGIEITARVFDKMIYIDVKDIHISANLDKLDTLLAFVQDTFGVEIKPVASEEKPLVDTILGLLKELELVYSSEKITLGYQDVGADIIFVGDDLHEIQITYKDIFAKATRLDEGTNIDKPAASVVYTPIENMYGKISDVYKYILGKTYYLTIEGSYKDFTITGAANYEDGKLSAEIKVVVYDQTASIRIFDKLVYIDFKGIHLTLSLDDIDTAVQKVYEKFGLESTEKQDNNVEDIIAKIMLSFDGSALTAQYDGLTAAVNFEGDFLKEIVVSYDELNVTITRKGEKASVTELDASVQYDSVLDVLDKAGEVYNYIKNNKFYVKVEADLGFKLLAHVNYDKDGLSASLSTMIDGLTIKAYLLNNVVYLDIDNLKLKFNLSNIEEVLEYIRDEFGKDLVTKYHEIKDKLTNLKGATDLDTSSLDLKQLLSDLQISLSGSRLDVEMSEFSAYALFDGSDVLKLINVKAEGVDVTLTTDKREDVAVSGEYFNVMKILPFITSVKSYVLGKKYSMVADAQVYEGLTQIYNAEDIVLQIDATDTLKFYADAKVTGLDGTKAAGFDLNLNASIFGNYLYANYNGLKLKIDTNGLQNLLTMVCEMFGIDPSILSIITGTESGDSGLDSSVVNKLLPKLDTENPLSMISMIKSLKVDGNTLDISLDGSFISSAERAEYMGIQIVLAEGKLSQLVIDNLYTGVTNNEHFYLVIDFYELTKMTEPDTNGYIDLSGAENLIRAIINTATHKSFSLTGKLKVDMKVIGIDIDWDVPLTIQVQIVDNKPIVYAEIGAIPVPLAGIVNNDSPWPNWQFPKINNRMLYIYYKDDFVYFYRHENRGENHDKGTYEKKLMAHIDTVLDDPIYYLQWGTGFKDSIIEEIRKSLAIVHDIDLGNVIKEFNKPADESGDYLITLNMEELTGNDKMGNMSVGIGLDTFEEKSVVGHLTFQMDMPLISGTTLYLKSNNNDKTQNLYLELDKEFDFSAFDEFVENYEYPENEEWDAENSDWKKAAEREFTVSFQTNVDGLTANAVTGKIGQTFVLPNYTEKHIVGEKKTDTDYTVYEFKGWYTDEHFATGTEFTEAKIPRYNVTLYAKWDVVEAWRTMTFMYNGQELGKQYGDSALDEQDKQLLYITQLQGGQEYIEEKDGIYLYKKKFAGWQDAQGIPLKTIQDESTTLYAYYETYQTLTEYTLSFETGVGEKLDPIKVYGGERADGLFEDYGKENVVIYENGVTTTYSFAGWFTDQAFELTFNGTMPQQDLTIYAKWDVVSVVYEWQLKIYDDEQLLVDTKLKTDTKITQDASLTQDLTYVLPETVRISNTTKWYLDAGFTQETSLPDVMPNNDLTLYIRNKYHVEYTYYELVNNTHTKKTYKTDLYQGETFNLLGQQSYYIDTMRVNKPEWLDYRTTYTFASYDYAPMTLTGSTARVDNQDMIFSSIVKTEKQNWYYITFDTTFVKPSIWSKDYKLVEKGDDIPEVAILAGETFDPDPSIYYTTGKYSYLGPSYNFKTLTWSLGDSCSNVGRLTNKLGNWDYTVLQPFKVEKDTTLRAVWGY